MHIDSVHKGKQLYECQKCPFKTLHKRSLKNHISVVHENYRPYKCEVCEKGFSELCNLDIHMAKFHKSKDDKVISKIDPENLSEIKSDTIKGTWTL